MVSACVSISSGLGSRPGWGHCVEFLRETHNSHSAFIHPGVHMCTGQFNTAGNAAMDRHPIQDEVIVLIA